MISNLYRLKFMKAKMNYHKIIQKFYPIIKRSTQTSRAHKATRNNLISTGHSAPEKLRIFKTTPGVRSLNLINFRNSPCKGALCPRNDGFLRERARELGLTYFFSSPLPGHSIVNNKKPRPEDN